MAEPVIRFMMPSVGAFEPAVALVRATGARGDGGLRHFAIEGPITTSQVWALLQLMQHTHWDYGTGMDVNFDPEPEWPSDGGVHEWCADQGRSI